MQVRHVHRLVLPAIIFTSFAIAPSIFATPIVVADGGVLSVSNLAGTMVGISNACINWGNPAACQQTTGIQDSASSIDTTDFIGGSTPVDTIKDLTAGELLPVVDFQTAQSPLPGGVVNFDLISFVMPGASGNCTLTTAPNLCSLAGSPFTFLQQTSDQVVISFATTEIAYTGTSASGSTPYQGIFSATLSGVLPNGSTVNIPDILNFIIGGGTVTATWSGTDSPASPSAVPEPSQLGFLFGAGLIGIVFLRKRFSSVS